MQNDQRPWYKEPFVWMIIGVPLSSVIAGVIFLSLAISTKDTLVRDNYYKDGLAINQELQWEKKAKELDIKVSFIIAGDELTLDLVSSRQTPPNTLVIKFSHPTLKEKDRDAFLQRGENGKYMGLLENIDNNRFYIQIESIEQSWRLKGDHYINQNTPITL